MFRIRRKEERQWPLLSSAVSPPIVVGNDGKATAYVNSGLVKLGILLVPGQFNWDASLIKTTKLTETRALQFRSEFFNLFNHRQFGNPATSRNSAFGQLNTTSNQSALDPTRF